MAKLLRGHVSIYAAYPEAFADRTAPTVAELNDTDFVKDISCAIEDSYTLNFTDPDTDNSLSICDVASVENPTFDNYEASLDGFRDEDTAATGVFNRFRDLFKVSGIPYILIKRIGPEQGTAWAVGQTASLYSFKTDNPTDIDASGAPIQLGARFKPQGWAKSNYEVAS